MTQWYSPEPAAQPVGIATSLKELGFDVSVLTGIPNYPTGRIHKGYRASQVSTHVVDGITVRRTPLFADHGLKTHRRIANYVSWALSSCFFGVAQVRRADVALVYSSPATAALPALMGRHLFGVPYVLVVQDVWPDSVFASGFLSGPLGRAARLMLESFVSWAYRSAATVVVISPGMVDLLANRGVPPEKLELIYNWVPRGHVGDHVDSLDLREQLGIGREEFVLLYAGNHGAGQALATAVSAFGRVGNDVHLVLVGDGVEKNDLRRRVKEQRLRNVHFLDQQPSSAMPAIVAAADAQLVSLADQPLFAVTMPSKVQAILASGKAAVVSAPGDAAAVVERAGAGIGVAPEDPRALAEAVLRLRNLPSSELRAMGIRGRELYLREMAEEIGSHKLADVLRRASCSHGDDRRAGAQTGE
ncbi:glycosyltransferase family 4 protein [Nocardioides sp.]|uniref:glycosyltransferase family 4 protein n=1 Tax=Nocardioides sp. TaxID=35761 RepID=UPI003784759E